MRSGPFPYIKITLIFAAVCSFFLSPLPAKADSLKFLFDYKYDVSKTETFTKATDTTPVSHQKSKTAKFSQLYSLDIQKEIFPTLKLNVGGLYDDDSSRSRITEWTSDWTLLSFAPSESRSTAIRPYVNLQYSSKMLTAAAGYRKSELKDSSSPEERTFTEEYSGQINWKPAELPQVDLTITRNLTYDEPLANDQQIDSYQLRSRYEYGDYRFNYNHTTNDTVNNINGSSTLSNFDDGTIRFSRGYLQNKVSVSSSLRANRQLVEFSGPADRDVAITGGLVQVNTNDINPLTSAPVISETLNDVDLLIPISDLPKQISFGFDFGTKTELSKIAINVDKASFRLPLNYGNNFTWNIYTRDNDTDNWTQINPPPATSTDTIENRIELSFGTLKARYIKIVTTQLTATEPDLQLSSLNAYRTLPPDTSEFKSTDFSGDMSVNWKMTDKTTSGFDFLYREQRAQPTGDKSTQLNTGLRLSHIFNEIFVGSMRAQRAESRKRGENPNTSHTFSASLRANYLDTFNQTLNYGFSEQNDEDSRTSISNSIFLRSNLDLYQGLSLFLDNGYSWRNPAEERDSNTTFARIGSNIIPNSWLNLALTYGVSWERQSGKPVERSQDGDLYISLIPTSSLSLSADLRFSDDTGNEHTSTAAQQYSVNWSPFRDGTLMFSMGYSQSMNADNEQVWSLSPSARWQLNRKTLLTLEYGIGTQEDDTEIVDYENISLALRIFY